MKLIPNALSVRVARSALLSRHNSPTFLFAAGVAGVTCSTVLACRATLRMSEVLEEAQSNLKIANSLEAADNAYDEAEHKKDVALIYVQSVVRVGALYVPAVVVGAASIAALTKSHSILTQRNVALTAAYGALDRGFREYRDRVVEKYGEDQDRDFRYPVERVEITGDKGRKKMVTRVSKDAEGSIYARFFDPTSPSWNRELIYNYEFLKCQQNFANDMLRSRGHVFLNEIYDRLGLERSEAGQVVGWVWNNPDKGDNFIDFGCFGEDGFSDFAQTHDNCVFLDFNVDGVIIDHLPKTSGINRINEVSNG